MPCEDTELTLRLKPGVRGVSNQERRKIVFHDLTHPESLQFIWKPGIQETASRL
jgi:hypothetical protein